LIELDGQQHFEDVLFDGKTSKLEIIRYHDQIKNNYINSLRISYSEIGQMKNHIENVIKNLSTTKIKGKPLLNPSYMFERKRGSGGNPPSLRRYNSQ
jgi:hypothetical protein